MSSSFFDCPEPPNSDDIALAQLMNADQTNLLDLIDQLRSMGIDKDVKLPKIIVCGDQSSGKSSVLEAIKRLPFPRGANLCTTFATEVALRRSSDNGTKLSVTIQPASHRTEEEKKVLSQYTPPSTKVEDFTAMINAAKSLLSSQRSARTKPDSFLEDVLKVEYSHPVAPQLTLVDLPGLIQSHDQRTQVKEDIQRVGDLVRRYMEEPGSIILAVVSSESDTAVQTILTKISEIDPEGRRTLGIIAKPDKAGERTQRMIEYARNERRHLRLGWHVLKNRGPKDAHFDLNDRDESETAFFTSQSISESLADEYHDKDNMWFPANGALKDEQTGIVELRKRLSNVLLDEIRLALPEILPSIRLKLKDCDSMLEKLGAARTTSLQQQIYLDKVSRQFQQLLAQAINGQYSDRHFFKPRLGENLHDPRRLRASLQALDEQFANRMFEKGHRRHFEVDSGDDISSRPSNYSAGKKNEHVDIEDSEKVTRTHYLSIVRNLMSKNRGTELPDAFDYHLVRELFCEQSEKWLQIAEEHIDLVCDLVEKNLREVIRYTADDLTADKILVEWIEPKMEKKKRKLAKRLQQLIAPYRESHPINYNRQYQDYLANIRIRNHDAMLKGQAESAVGSFDQAASDLLDSMEAFYSSALHTFIDNVAVLAVEMTLVSRLDKIFTPSDIIFMEPEMLHLLASELEVNQRKRVALTEKRANLQEALKLCRSHAAPAPAVELRTPKQSSVIPETPGLVPSTPRSESYSPGSSSAPRTPASSSRSLRESGLGGSPGKMPARKLGRSIRNYGADDKSLVPSVEDEEF